LTIAATVGRRFEFNLMRTVSGTSSETLVDRLDELIRARFIEPAPDAFGASFEFSHELIRQTVLGSLSQPRRQQLHLQLAEAIEQLPADRIDDRMLDLARHFYQAGPLADPARASECLTRAGERYLTASAFEEALRCFDRALALRSQTDSTLAEIKYKRGIAQRSLGLWDEALRSWEQSLTTYEALNEFEAAGRICAALNTQLSWAGRWIEAIKMGARGLALLGDRSSADRCRLLAANGATLGLAGHHDAGLAMINQSLAMAAEIGEPRLKGLAMYALVLHHYAYMRTRSSLETCLAAIEQLNPVSDGWLTTDLMIFVIEAHLSFGQFEQMALSLAELKPLASRLGHFVALISATRDEKSRDLISSGDIASWKEFLLGDLKECERIQNPAISAGALSALGVIEMWRGDWAEARVHMKEGEAREPAGPLGGDWVTIAMHDVYSGRHAQALALLERRRREFPRADQPNSRAAWMVMLSAVEVFFVAGEPRSAAEFYPMVLEAIESGVMFRAFDFRLLETVAGIAATAGRDWPAAERHFRRAIHICDALPHRIEQPEVRRFYAQMLLQRGQPGDRETACKLLREAIGAYAEIGMPKHREMAKVLLNSLESPPPAWAPKIVESSFRREGQYWTIAFEGRVVRLKDTKGLRDIVNLLASPGKALHVVELMAASVGEVPVSRVGTSAAALAQDGLSTAGRSSEPSIDTRARQAYRERLNDLRIELDDAERMGDAVVAEHARKEMEQITEHLILAFGLTGLARGADDPIERARIAVRVRIQSALKRIREEHPVLGRHLAHAVKTGTFCTYEAELPQRWEISA
jgi:tetratricopeptide (TPR) repeat protein